MNEQTNVHHKQKERSFWKLNFCGVCSVSPFLDHIKM